MKFYALAFELVALNLALILGGYYLDSLLSTSPIIILIGTVTMLNQKVAFTESSDWLTTILASIFNC